MGSRHIAFRAADGPLPRTGAEELAAGSGPSAGDIGDAVIDFGRSAEAEAAPGSVVELGGDGGALTLRERGEVGAFGQVLPEKPIGVLVGAAFPGVVRSGEVEFGAQALLDCFVQVELGTVISGDRMNGMRFVAEDVGSAAQGLAGSDAREFADADQAAHAFDYGDGGGLAAAVYGIDLPIAGASALLDDGGAFTDHPLAGEAAAAVVTSVAFAPQLTGATQTAPKRATVFLVGPEVQIDRLVAHGLHALEPEASHDLLRAEILAQHPFNGRKVLRRVAAITPGAATAPVGLLDRAHGPVCSIIAGAVPPDLAIDRTGMPFQLPCDLCGTMPARAHRCDSVSFVSA